MLKRWTALLLAVMLIFLTACSAQKEYKLSAVFAAAEEDRPQWLADPDNAALWEQLGLSGSVVSDGDPAALTIGAQNWVLQPATVEGRSVTLCYCVDEQNRPLLDLRASFGINVLPVEEWTACEDLFIVRVWARQGGDYRLSWPMASPMPCACGCGPCSRGSRPSGSSQCCARAGWKRNRCCGYSRSSSCGPPATGKMTPCVCCSMRAMFR